MPSNASPPVRKRSRAEGPRSDIGDLPSSAPEGHTGWIHNYPRLDVWRRSYDLGLSVHETTATWPDEEKYGLVSQLRRASVLIPSNIAEGTSQSSPKAFGRYLRIALGSACEADTHLRLSADFGYTDRDSADHLLGEIDGIKRMLVALIRNLQKPGSKI